MKLRITGGKGVHYEFENGLVLSVQIGPGNYSENYNEPFSFSRNPNYQLPPSETAEIALWDANNTWVKWTADSHNYAVLGYIQVRYIVKDLIPFLMQLPNGTTADQVIIPPQLLEYMK